MKKKEIETCFGSADFLNNIICGECWLETDSHLCQSPSEHHPDLVAKADALAPEQGCAQQGPDIKQEVQLDLFGGPAVNYG